jgi:elongation factor P hydroxylase
VVSPLSETQSDVPVSPQLIEVRNTVRRMEAETAVEHGVDTPAYWRAMSDRLAEHLATNRFAPVHGRYADQSAELAHRWLVRIASAYRALASTGVR